MNKNVSMRRLPSTEYKNDTQSHTIDTIRHPKITGCTQNETETLKTNQSTNTQHKHNTNLQTQTPNHPPKPPSCRLSFVWLHHYTTQIQTKNNKKTISRFILISYYVFDYFLLLYFQFLTICVPFLFSNFDLTFNKPRTMLFGCDWVLNILL